jgi:hypothetical protein
MVTVVPGSKAALSSKSTRKKNKIDYNKLNMNAISPRLWMAFPGMTEDVLAQITDFRKTQDFKSFPELQKIVGPQIYAGMKRYLTLTQIPYFIIHSVATINDSKITEEIKAIVCVTNRSPKNYEVFQWNQGTSVMRRFAAGNKIQNG